MKNNVTQAAVSSGSILLPLALAQFICSYAASNMNVAISVIVAALLLPRDPVKSSVSVK